MGLISIIAVRVKKQAVQHIKFRIVLVLNNQRTRCTKLFVILAAMRIFCTG